MYDFINDKKHLRVSGALMESKYFNYILSPTDVRIFMALWNKVLAPNSRYYRRGQLVINIKQETLSNLTGISRATLIRSLKKLDELGVIIKIRQKQNNNCYMIGFRSHGNEWLLFLYHLVKKYEDLLSEYIEDRINNNESAEIKDLFIYKLNSSLKNYMIQNFNSKFFFTNKLTDDKNIMEILFNRKDIFTSPELILMEKYQNDT